jgi:hypothetical protein
MNYTDRMNLRLTAYCNAKGYKTFDERMKIERTNTPVIEWIHEQWILFRDEFLPGMPYPFYMGYSIDFDKWLKNKFPHN